MLVDVASIAVLMVAIAGKPAHWCWSVPIAVLFRYVGQHIVIGWTAWLGYPRIYGVLSSPLKDSLPHFAGMAFISVVVFVVARMTGLSFRRADTT
jgi:hypothetical protein